MKQYGIDYLGMGNKYPQIVIDHHPKNWAVGFFTEKELFGDPFKNIQKLIVVRRDVPSIRLNLKWEDSHIFKQEDIKNVVASAKRYKSIIEDNPQIKWYVSPATEHLMKANEIKNYINAVQDVYGDLVTIVNNPDARNNTFVKMQNVIQEVHGTKQNPPRGKFIYSYDGSSCVDDDVELRKSQMKNAEIFFFWHPAMNGRLKSEDTTPRPERKSYPTKELVKSMFFLRNKRQTDGKMPQNWLWKSHADRHTTPPEPRAYKPVVLGNDTSNVLQLCLKNGQVIATSTQRAPMDGQPQYKFRWYFSDYGYILARRAMRLQKGDPVCVLKAGNKTICQLNPAFRNGTFRDK